MNILAYTRTPREDEEGIRYVSLEELLKNSDYVSLHCPLTESTKHMINREALSLMKPSAFIINTSRGALIDETAPVSYTHLWRNYMIKMRHMRARCMYLRHCCQL